MNNNLEDIKLKLEKLLRLSESSNANEAAVAINKFNSLCRQYGVAKKDLTISYREEFDEIVEMAFGKTFYRRDVAENLILVAVANYYNGSAIIGFDYTYSSENPKKYTAKTMNVIASKGNQIQIEIYYNYIIEIMEKMSKVEKRKRPNSPKAFRRNFRKGFAITINKRLKEIKKKDEKEGIRETNQSGLLVLENNEKEFNNALKYLKENYPNLKNYPGSKTGVGVHEGMEAAQTVGLDKQTEGIYNKKINESQF